MATKDILNNNKQTINAARRDKSAITYQKKPLTVHLDNQKALPSLLFTLPKIK